jgi:hypothetical protein
MKRLKKLFNFNDGKGFWEGNTGCGTIFVIYLTIRFVVTIINSDNITETFSGFRIYFELLGPLAILIYLLNILFSQEKDNDE